MSEENFFEYVHRKFSHRPELKKMILDAFTINKLKMTQP
ncbi:hypothetical protein KLEB273_gp219 [Bacillus phage vB_BauM_KLEB27-3]|nr:hypothetical protein KLEB273_gp219 [Bacillus phage vB_BauM_KLEB27-3]